MCVKPLTFSPWKFCGSIEALKSLWMSSSSMTIFFDGTSNGNLGISGAGGLVLLPDNQIESSISWGLGNTSNNQAECYSLLMAC